MEYINLNKSDCSGCSSCKQVCSFSAISMVPNEEGFLYAEVDADKCRKCGACVKVCPALSKNTLYNKNFEQKYYAARHIDDNIVAESSSGGAFTALSENVLASGGVVYGAIFDDLFRVVHERIDDEVGIAKFRGSKYVQSNIEEVFERLLDDLREGKKVLFSGTPCQCAGIKSFVGFKRGNMDNLILCDFVCHGVSSPVIWRDYIEHLNEVEGNITFYNFRGKADGWHKWYPQIATDRADISLKYKNKKSYIALYGRTLSARPSCYTCLYTSYKRVSDITLGDFWNIQKAARDMDDDKGTNQIIINSAKGYSLFEECKDSMVVKACRKTDVWQPHLEYPINAPRSREHFWKEYKECSFENFILKYGKYPLTTTLRMKVMPVIERLGLYSLAGKIYNMVFGSGKRTRR